ncbi:MAG: alkaline phosphatase family protein [Thermoplasmata archaeon]|nr:alkaline phosphatase family protein [Thermoplasmata archaeon]
MRSQVSWASRRVETTSSVILVLAALTLSGLSVGVGASPVGPSVRIGSVPAATHTPSGPNPSIQHVVVVPLENEELSEVWANGPYERYLAANYGNATNYYAACHPSAPNYLGMFAAVANQCGSDSWANYTNATLAGEFDAASLTWGQYAESLPGNACSSPGTATAGMFATRHTPALWFASILGNQSYCNAHVLSSSAFNGSVANGTLRNYSYYTPNLCDDGHNGCGNNTTDAQMTLQADTWLRDWLSPILNHTGGYDTPEEEETINHTAFILTWDEGTGSNAGFAVPGVTSGDNYLWCGQNGETGDAACGGHIYTAIVSPYSRNTTFKENDSTYGLCRTVEWLFHLAPLGNPGDLDNVSGFPAMTSLFRFPAAAFNVTVEEHGLAAGTTWSFNVSGQPSEDTNASSLALSLPNGTYSFVAAASGREWDSPNGSFDVNGTPTNVSVGFVAATFSVVFADVGLPNGTWWHLNVSTGIDIWTTSAVIGYRLTDGTDSYSAYTNTTGWPTPHGNFTVANSSVLVNVTFGPRIFEATVSESGLPAGLPWWVNVTGSAPVSSIAPAIELALPAGSYRYFASADGNVWSRANGALDLEFGPTSASVVFTLETYPVTFTSLNLSAGSSWSLTFGGATEPVASGSIAAFVEPNGTYRFGATGPSNAPPLESAGTLQVAGAPYPELIPFDPVLEVTSFVSSPTTAGLGGSLQLEVTVVGGTGPHTFAYSGLPLGCTGPDSPSLECTPSRAGQYSVTVVVTDSLGARTSGTTSFGVSSNVVAPPKPVAGTDWTLVAGVGVVVVLVAIAALMVWRRSRTRDP